MIQNPLVLPVPIELFPFTVAAHGHHRPSLVVQVNALAVASTAVDMREIQLALEYSF